MTRWILAAEADKIQHLVFRSSHLREVVGGSQLLTVFCREDTLSLLSTFTQRSKERTQQDIVVADGGSFTILFDGEDGDNVAVEFGKHLAQKYRERTGSTLTVAAPTKWDGTEKDFPVANACAREALARAKQEGRAAETTTQMPYTAWCASCGIGLACTHGKLHAKQTDEDANYLCEYCQAKAQARDQAGRDFLREFKKAVVVGAHAEQCNTPDEADDLANAWDTRNYIAYLIADGNSMGRIFGECTSPSQLHDLSESMSQVIRNSLAAPTKQLMKQIESVLSSEHLIPVLPLILGGDDVFVMLPAPYALDFARRFCCEYETQMTEALQHLGFTHKPTMAAAVVVCKSKYPHTLAHQHGERLLKEAKRLSKAVAQQGINHMHSTVHFDLILGSRLADSAEDRGEYRPSLRPYWVTNSALPEHVGLSIDTLLTQRHKLRNLPSRRLSQIRHLFDPGEIPANADEVRRWQARLTNLITRVGRSSEAVAALNEALVELGGKHEGHWYFITRPDPKQDHFRGHGLPDLINFWDFSLDMEHRLTDYSEQEDSA